MVIECYAAYVGNVVLNIGSVEPDLVQISGEDGADAIRARLGVPTRATQRGPDHLQISTLPGKRFMLRHKSLEKLQEALVALAKEGSEDE